MTVHLPVLRPPRQGRAVRRPSSIAHWRAGVLITVHLLMAGHILHWWLTGRSAGKFVLSDTMRTLETGAVNPGALLFAASLIVTAVFGRFMCGWVCHMGALQDLCAWLLRRVGIRPRLFRSRLLGLVPLGLALYMFVWPSAARLVLGERAPFPGFSADLVTDDLWRDLPRWEVAVPFLLVCGFATVYFLGARGLCRYGCPYGGFLLPAARLAPARVVVDPALCDQCGICTAACTAGVRVHDQVRLFGSVIDHNCVRSFDCIGACPRRALSFSFAAPVRASGGRTSGEALPWREELLCAAVFLPVFFVLRGLYDLIPMLMAATLAGLCAFLAWKASRVLTDANVRLGPVQLRLHSRLRPGGWAFLAAAALAAALLLHSGVVRAFLLIGSRHDDRVAVAYPQALWGEGVPATDREEARRARGWYALGRPWWRGGIALTATPSSEYRLAWVMLVCGDRAGATGVLRDLAGSVRAGPNAPVELARLMLADGRAPDAVRVLEESVRAQPRWAPPRDMLAMLWAQGGRGDRAEAMYRDVLAARPSDAPARIGLARLLAVRDGAEAAVAELRVAARWWPGSAPVRAELAAALAAAGHGAEAASELRSAAAAIPASRAALLERAAALGRSGP
ncbi:MAG: 4Fe-4S binding protein [Phycisphaerales bacterium]|nr:4Fe-4S binding protein [Phycisphaerales bacterium]